MSPGLDPCGGGDGLEFVDLTFLRVLCLKYPQLTILATVLSKSNQVRKFSLLFGINFRQSC